MSSLVDKITIFKGFWRKNFWGHFFGSEHTPTTGSPRGISKQSQAERSDEGGNIIIIIISCLVPYSVPYSGP